MLLAKSKLPLGDVCGKVDLYFISLTYFSCVRGNQITPVQRRRSRTLREALLGQIAECYPGAKDLPCTD
jgi:hypothetical protein